ncbi:MAG: DNA circularization N-terminal domain-containing protein [Treponema sp.]|nr:DNA circularization N-terminal domain-containing protein [Treponema sp.]
MSFDASLPTVHAKTWRQAERQDTEYPPRLTSYQAPGGEPITLTLERFDFSGGQSVDTAEYPFGGLWSNERLNEKPQVLHLQGFIRGPEYITTRNALIESLRVSTDDETPGFIDLPFWGRFPVVVTEYNVSEKTDEKGQCSVSIDCTRAGVSPHARTEAEEAQNEATTKARAEALQEAAIAALEQKLEENLDTNTLVQGFSQVRSVLLSILGRVQAAQTTLNTITNTINALSSLIAQGIRSPQEFARAFFNAAASIFAGLLEIKNSVDSYEDFSSYPAPANTNERNVLLQFLAASTFTLEGSTATIPQQNTKEAIEQCYWIGALCIASQIIVQMGVISSQTAHGYWTLLQHLEARINQDNPVIYAAIEDLRMSVSQELVAKELSAEVHRTVTVPLPLLALAQYVGCDGVTLQELNRIADSFMIKGEVVYV